MLTDRPTEPESLRKPENCGYGSTRSLGPIIPRPVTTLLARVFPLFVDAPRLGLDRTRATSGRSMSMLPELRVRYVEADFRVRKSNSTERDFGTHCSEVWGVSL